MAPTATQNLINGISDGQKFNKSDFDPVIEALKKGENTNLNQNDGGGEEENNIDGKEISFSNLGGSSENNNIIDS